MATLPEKTKLPKVVGKRAKRVGRGYRSGKGGHTSGRGQKGQKSRTSINILFEGVKTKKSLLRRLPQLRGKSRHKAAAKPEIVNIKDLEKLPAGSVVDLATLVKYNLVDETRAQKFGVKILGIGSVNKKLDIRVPTSKR